MTIKITVNLLHGGLCQINEDRFGSLTDCAYA